MTPSNPPGDRAFGLSVGSVCLGAAVLSWWRDYPTAAIVLAGIGTLLVGLGGVAPAALRIPNRVWWRFAQTLGWINARVVLTVFFAVILTPVGVVMRMFGRNPLRASHTDTNWRPYPPRRRDSRHYERLF